MTLMIPFLRSKKFWLSFSVSALFMTAFFGWALGLFGDLLPKLPRPEAEMEELIFTALLIFLFALNAGLFVWCKDHGSCPIGTRRASGLAGSIGVLTLLCPVCLALPAAFFGISTALAFLSPFLPLLRVIAVILLVVSTAILWPRKGATRI